MEERDSRGEAQARLAEQAVPIAAGVPVFTLIEDLKRVAGTQLDSALKTMFDEASEFLLELSEKALNNVGQRVALDALRVLRQHRGTIAEHFRTEFQAGFAPDTKNPSKLGDREITDEDLVLKDSEVVEEMIALSNLEARTEGIYRRELWEIDRRLSWLIKYRAAPMSIQSLSPASICNAFRRGLDAAHPELEVRMVLFKVFDKLFIGRLHAVFEECARLLITRGVWARNSHIARGQSSGGGAPAGPASADPNSLAGGDQGSAPSFGGDYLPGPRQDGGYVGGSGGGYAPGGGHGAQGGSGGITQGGGGYRTFGSGAGSPYSSPLERRAASARGQSMGGTAGAGSPDGAGGGFPVDGRTFEMLMQVGGRGGSAPASGVYNDSDLAVDLTSVAQGRPAPGWSTEGADATMQRVSLVGRLFNELIEEPNLPRQFMEQIDPLRFAVIKSALSDSAFFTNPGHPVRSMVNELALLASMARTLGPDAVQRIDALSAHIKDQFEDSAEDARLASETAESISNDAVEQFIEQQVEETKVRRRTIVAKVREVVSAELKLRTSSIKIPGSARPLLFSGWSVIMAYRLTHHGAESPQWTDGLSILDRTLDLLGPPVAGVDRNAELSRLGTELRRALIAVRIDGAKVDSMLSGFGEAVESANAQSLSTAPLDFEDKGAAASPLSTVYITRVDSTLLIDLLMVAGRWFQVLDRKRDERRWLKYIGRSEAGPDHLVFAEFNGRNPLEIEAEQLIEDLITHRSEPIDAPPACRQALDTAIAKREREVEAAKAG